MTAAPATSDCDAKRVELDLVEDDVGRALHSAGTCLVELSKDKPSIKQVEGQASEFLNLIKTIENRLCGQINYLAQIGAGSAHEGSIYRSRRQRNDAVATIDYVRGRLAQANVDAGDSSAASDASAPASS